MRHIRVTSLTALLVSVLALPASAQDVSGTWLLAVDLGSSGSGEATFVLSQEGSEITGTYSGSYGTAVPVTGSVQDGRVDFSFRTIQMGEITYVGTVEGPGMRGDVTYGTTAEGTFEGERAVFTEPMEGDALWARIDSLAAELIGGGRLSGFTIGVRRGGGPVRVEGYGLADIENDVPAGPETVYRIGSITKQFTAAAILQLVEAGEVGLDDPMTDYLPDYPTEGREVTIRHLLDHTSGIEPYTAMEEWRETMRLDLTDQELVDLFSAEPFNFEPGESFQYNNSGYFLLGMIVEAVSGEPYRDYLDAHLFGPLGLSGSTYCDERSIIPHRAEGYAVVDGGLVNDEPISMNHPGAAGALCSTAPDLLRWSEALRSGEVVSEEGYALMRTSGTLDDGSETGYGFGLQLGQLVGIPSVSHGGGIPGFASMLSHYPTRELDLVVLTNTEGPFVGQIAELAAKWALGIPVESVRDEPITPEEVASYVGVYELGPGFELTVFEQAGVLWAGATGQANFRLRPQGDHVFIPTFDDEVRIEFVMEDGRAESLILFQGGRREAPRVR